MASSDLLVSLVRAASRGDQVQFRRSVEAIIADERSKQHHVLADKLAEQLLTTQAVVPRPNGAMDNQIQNYVYEIAPQRTLDDIVLPADVEAACREVIEEHHRSDVLHSYGLEPRHRILLAGPPGNGKTTLAEALAEALMLPMLIIRYDMIIGSFLGETAARLRRVFEYVRTRRCVLFLDEFDTLGKERGDVHETGEIKRVVSSLLLQTDALPSYVVLVSATNHPELLDRAVWRRFQLRLHLPNPTKDQIEEWLRRFEDRLGHSLEQSTETLASTLVGTSFAEVEEFGTDILRRYRLAQPPADFSKIVNDRLVQWKARYTLAATTGATAE